MLEVTVKLALAVNTNSFSRTAEEVRAVVDFQLNINTTNLSPLLRSPYYSLYEAFFNIPVFVQVNLLPHVGRGTSKEVYVTGEYRLALKVDSFRRSENVSCFDSTADLFVFGFVEAAIQAEGLQWVLKNCIELTTGAEEIVFKGRA